MLQFFFYVIMRNFVLIHQKNMNWNHVVLLATWIGITSGLLQSVSCQDFDTFDSFSDTKGFVRSFEKSSSVYPFQNASFTTRQRVDDLVGRLTLEELVQQLSMGGANGDGPAPAITRLGIKPYQWNTECLRGYAFAGDATCFPQPIGLAASFDPPMIERMASIVSWEARAKVNNFTKYKDYQDHTGLSCFAPVINIMRHPLWGRNQETYGEDPFLTAMFAERYVRGLQGYNNKYAAATAVCKHFDVHGGPEDVPNRFGFNAVVSDRDWQMTHLPAFRACIQSGAHGVMCSYNAINGIPACANKKLLTVILRGELGFQGYVVSDEGAIEHIDLFFKYTKTYIETAVAAIKAGVNLELTYFGPLNRFFLLKEAVNKGLVSEDLLRERAKPLFHTRFDLGEFDPPGMNPYNDISTDDVQSEEHREFAIEITAKTFVLLKNQDKALPINKVYNRATVIGPFTNNSEAITGDYFTQFSSDHFTAPFQGIQKLSDSKVIVAKGCVGPTWNKLLPICTEYSEDEVKATVPGSDLVVVTLGTGTGVEAEGLDRATLRLPGKQLDLLKSVVRHADKNAKIVLLLFNAGPLDVSWAVNSSDIDAIIACHFPAQSAGEAIYRVLSGQDNPAARLPSTWPASLSQVPPITNYSMHERTYRYSSSPPLFPFGYGLSYTTFHYSNLHVGSSFHICDSVAVSVTVTNTGDVYGEEVTQVYMSWLNATVETPRLQLVSFSRFVVDAGKSLTLSFVIKAEQRSVWKDEMVLEPGKMMIYVGGQQPNQAVKVPSNVLSAAFTIQGNSTPSQNC